MCAKREKCEYLEGVAILIREEEESGAMRCSEKQQNQCMTHGAVMCCLCISPARGFPISANNTTAVLSLPPPVCTPFCMSLYTLAAPEWFMSTTRARQPIIPLPSFRRIDFWAAREEHILPPIAHVSLFLALERWQFLLHIRPRLLALHHLDDRLEDVVQIGTDLLRAVTVAERE